MALFFCLLACKPVEPAPDDLETLFHWMWAGFEDEEDARLREGGVNLEALVSEALTGSLEDLTPDEQSVVELDAPADPAEATGIFLAGELLCDMATLESIVIDLDQLALYPDAYDTYERTYLDDADAYLDRAAPMLGWETNYTTTPPIGAPYSERLYGGVRWVPAGDEGGALLLARVWMPEPAVFESGSARFEQDYQIEAYVERSDGVLVHAYAIWREFDLGAGLDMENEGVQRLTLDSLGDWDRATEQRCAER